MYRQRICFDERFRSTRREFTKSMQPSFGCPNLAARTAALHKCL